MKAQEMRQRALQAEPDQYQKEHFESTLNTIKEYADRGETSIACGLSPEKEPVWRRMLEAEGFTFTSHIEAGQPYYKINW